MQNTTNYGLKLYDNGDAASLIDGYNASMNTLDTKLKQIEDDAASSGATLPDGLEAFCTALGLNSGNATALGTFLKNLNSKTSSDTLTVGELANAKVVEGYVLAGGGE